MTAMRVVPKSAKGVHKGFGKVTFELRPTHKLSREESTIVL